MDSPPPAAPAPPPPTQHPPTDPPTDPSARTPTTAPPGGGRASLGRYGERIAARYLRDVGVEVLETNWRCRHGEVDIVALQDGCLVVCEVKTRRAERFGSPVEAVTHAKLARLRRLAAAWLAQHDLRVEDVRVDVIGVLRPREGHCRIEHLVGVS